MSQLTAAQIAGMMDISLLQPQFTRDDIDKLIDQAIKYKMASGKTANHSDFRRTGRTRKR